MKTRSSSGVGQKIDLEFNIDSLRITDLAEEDSYGSGSQSAGSSLLASIKNRQTVDPDTGELNPATGIAVPKVTAKVESSKLRELLNNLPGDDI
jgi:hypothetical protein